MSTGLVMTTNWRRAILSFAQPELLGCSVRLYTNVVTLSPENQLSDFNEPEGQWYAPIKLSNWGVPYINTNSQGEIDEVIRTWTVGTEFLEESIQGYFVVDQNNNLAWAEADTNAPAAMNSPGDTYSVRPRLMLGPLC